MWARMLGNGKCQQLGVWADLELMSTWCPTGVVCDLPIREYVSELGMYPCLSVCPDGGGAWYVFGVRAGRPSSCIYYYYFHYISMGRYGRVYRPWASASSGAYRRVMQVTGLCDVYRTVFCPTLRSLNVHTYSARVPPPPPPELLYCVGLSILTAVSLRV